MTALGILWYVLILVLMAGYFVLDGFDLGVGVLYPFIAKDDKSKMALIHAIGPVWDGNEVWLLTCGGALFAAFAPAYATSFSGFYLAIMLVLFGLILRAVSVVFRGHEEDFHKLWDVMFFIGSLLPALLFGVAIGNVVESIPLNANGDYTGGFVALLNPFALLCGVLGLVTMIAQGASWIALKSPVDGVLRKKALRIRKIACIASIVLVLIVSVLFVAVIIPGLNYTIGNTVLCAAMAIVFVVVNAAVVFVCGGENPSGDLVAQILVSLGCVALVVLIGATLFPNFIPAVDPALSLNIANCQATDVTLLPMTIIACIGVPIVLVYHVIVYRSFRGRAEK